MVNEPVDLAERLSRFSEHWSPKVVARLNDYEVKVVKVEGEFVWHTHEDTDELFLVIDGELTVQLRDGDVVLRPGQLYVVPRGVEHCPSADGEVHAVLVEPTGVVNTGDAGGPMTAQYDDSLAAQHRPAHRSLTGATCPALSASLDLAGRRARVPG
jgi:mannose-6-phosphate isomerase-like protein (cupin superfamily)